jgi:hypothetical protein
MDGGDAVWSAMMCGGVYSCSRRISIAGLGILFLLAFAERAEAQRHRDPCRLLSDAEVRTVQGEAPAQKVASDQPAASFKFTQCFYRTQKFTNSVSVALGIPLTDDGKRLGPVQYWRQQFHKKPSNVPSRKKKEPPKPVEGLGDEAFWVGDPMTGALYVLQGDVFLRVSVGGPPDQSQKIQRSKTLASYALKRLDATPTAR